MKRLLFFILLIPFIARSQDDSTKYITYRFEYGKKMARVMPDSILHTPYLDTTFKPVRPGALTTRPADNLIYWWNGTKWNLFGSGGGTTTNALTINNTGTGDASGSTFNGSAAKTISYNSIGAEASFTETTQEFTGSTSMSITLSNTPKSGKAEMYYRNGIALSSADVSRTGTTVTFSNFIRVSGDVITAKYSY